VDKKNMKREREREREQTHDLFMVIAKLSLTRNYFLLSTNGSPELAFVFNLILARMLFFQNCFLLVFPHPTYS